MDNPSLSAHWASAQKRPEDAELRTEAERWMTLIEDVDKYALSRSPLKYGPLSVDGYIHARTEQYRIMNNERWDMHPEQIATLLLACNITINQVTPTLLKHYEAAMPKAAPEDLLVLQYITLTKLGKPPGTADAIEILAGIPTDRYDHDNQARDDATLRALAPFCHGAQDQTGLVAALLRDPAVSRGRYGKSSYLTSLAHYFPDADAEEFALHCVSHDDYQALAMLVEQGRMPLEKWIVQVARSIARTRHPRNEKYGRGDNEAESLEVRQHEILDSFIRLRQSNALEAWTHGIAIARHDISDLTERLLRMGPHPETDFDGWLAWGCGWATLGLADVDHPVLAEQIKVASNTIKKSFSGKPPAALPVIRQTSALPTSWFLCPTNPVLALGPAIRDLVAQRFLFAWETPDVNDLWRISPSRLWFKDADIAEVLCYRWDTKSFRESLDWMVALLPALPPRLWPGLGARITQACHAQTLKARNVRATWKDQNPDYFGPSIPAQHQNGALILYALTRKDPSGVSAMTSALGVASSSATYRAVLEQWLEQSLGGAQPAQERLLLPSI